MDIVYHGGMHKTGTTAIQRWLENNGALLGSMGILAHTPTNLGPFFQTDDEGLRARLVAMICDARSAGYEQVIIGVDSGRGQDDTLSAIPVPFDDVRDGIFRDTKVPGDPSV